MEVKIGDIMFVFKDKLIIEDGLKHNAKPFDVFNWFIRNETVLSKPVKMQKDLDSAIRGKDDLRIEEFEDKLEAANLEAAKIILADFDNIKSMVDPVLHSIVMKGEESFNKIGYGEYINLIEPAINSIMNSMGKTDPNQKKE